MFQLTHFNACDDIVQVTLLAFLVAACLAQGDKAVDERWGYHHHGYGGYNHYDPGYGSYYGGAYPGYHGGYYPGYSGAYGGYYRDGEAAIAQ